MLGFRQSFRWRAEADFPSLVRTTDSLTSADKYVEFEFAGAEEMLGMDRIHVLRAAVVQRIARIVRVIALSTSSSEGNSDETSCRTGTGTSSMR